MKLILGILLCLILASTGDSNSKINGDSCFYPVSGFFNLALEKFEFENLGKDIRQNSITYYYKRIKSPEEITLFLETLEETELIWSGSVLYNQRYLDYDEEKLAYWDTNYFEENALILIILEAPTVPYFYECESVTIEEETVLVTVNVSNSSTGDCNQLDLLMIETKHFSDKFPIQMLLIEE